MSSPHPLSIRRRILLALTFSLLHLLAAWPPGVRCAQNDSADTPATRIDRVVSIAAFHSLGPHPHTAVIHPVDLPPDLSGSTHADAARYRAGSMRRYGVDIKEFRIPKGVVTSPGARRIVLVRENLGNLSFTAYGRYAGEEKAGDTGFRLVSSVVGLLVYSASAGAAMAAYIPTNSTPSTPIPAQLELFAGGDPIMVDFSADPAVGRVSRTGGQRRGWLCASFRSTDGFFNLTDPVSPNVCAARRQGHFALVIRFPSLPGEGEGEGGGGNGWKRDDGVSDGGDINNVSNRYSTNKWKALALIVAASTFAAVLLGLVAVAVFKTKKKRKAAEMERRAYEEEALQISMIGLVRAPSAAAARTTPILEEEYCHSSGSSASVTRSLMR